MKRIPIALTLAAWLLTLLVAGVPVRALPPARASVVPGGVGPVQVWRTGFMVKPLPVYGDLAGRAAAVAAAVQSSADAHSFFVFPAVASPRGVRSASFYILERSGSYAGAATMTLEIYDYAGNLQHVVSAGTVDLQTAEPLAWTDLALSGSSAGRLVEPGEFLAFHFALSGAPDGDLDVRPVFEVTVGPLQVVLPVVLRSS